VPFERIPRHSNKTESGEHPQQTPDLTVETSAPTLSIDGTLLLAKQWRTFWQLRQSPYQAPHDTSLVREGYLTHHCWGTGALAAILASGVLSGELRPAGGETVPEDGETHYCADFFRSATDRTVPDYAEYVATKVRVGAVVKPRSENYAHPGRNNERMAIVIDPTQPGLEDLLAFSGTGRDSAALAQTPIRFPTDNPTHLAVFVGIPANYINFIIAGDRLEGDEERLNALRETLRQSGLNIPVVTTSGERIA